MLVMIVLRMYYITNIMTSYQLDKINIVHWGNYNPTDLGRVAARFYAGMPRVSPWPSIAWRNMAPLRKSLRFDDIYLMCIVFLKHDDFPVNYLITLSYIVYLFNSVNPLIIRGYMFCLFIETWAAAWPKILEMMFASWKNPKPVKMFPKQIIEAKHGCSLPIHSSIRWLLSCNEPFGGKPTVSWGFTGITSQYHDEWQFFKQFMGRWIYQSPSFSMICP